MKNDCARTIIEKKKIMTLRGTGLLYQLKYAVKIARMMAEIPHVSHRQSSYVINAFLFILILQENKNDKA